MTPPLTDWKSASHRRTWLLHAALLIIFFSTLSRYVSADGPAKARSSGRANAGGNVAPAVGVEPDQPLREPRLPRGRPPVDEEAAPGEEPSAFPAGFQPEKLVSPGGLSSTLNLMILMTVLSLAPSILIMTTCFVRFIVVLGLLRQALGTQQLPPNQVLLALCLFLTFMVMTPVWQQSYDEGIRPYTNPEPGEPIPTTAEVFTNSVRPIRRFMSEQIDRSGNNESVWMFLDYQRASEESLGRSYVEPKNFDEVPLATLVSSFMLSELKSAFVIGFQIYLPFLVIDMVVATVLMSMGMMMLPPTLVSFPFKLLLFVLIDGWALTVGMMLDSVRPSG